jgi:hypothetical protein
VVETAPVWVNSAPLQLQAGQWVRIHGWVRVDRPILGSVDGLMVVDSLGGPCLAQRVYVTNGWQEIALWRGTPHAAELVITCALTGTGQVLIDEFTVELAE